MEWIGAVAGAWSWSSSDGSVVAVDADWLDDVVGVTAEVFWCVFVRVVAAATPANNPVPATLAATNHRVARFTSRRPSVRVVRSRRFMGSVSGFSPRTR